MKRVEGASSTSRLQRIRFLLCSAYGVYFSVGASYGRMTRLTVGKVFLLIFLPYLPFHTWNGDQRSSHT